MPIRVITLTPEGVGKDGTIPRLAKASRGSRRLRPHFLIMHISAVASFLKQENGYQTVRSLMFHEKPCCFSLTITKKPLQVKVMIESR
jgi:hypothetical protein